MNNTEKMLIVLDLESYSKETIERGVKISKGFELDIKIVFLIPEDTNIINRAELEFALAETRKVCNNNDIKEFDKISFADERDFLKQIQKIKNEYNIKHIVFAHVVEERFFEIFHGSFINYILKRNPDLELHLVAPSRVFHEILKDYQDGQITYINNAENDPEFSYTSTDSNALRGIFFQEKATQFDTGIFVDFISDESKMNAYKIVDGSVSKQFNYNDLYK